MIFIRVTLERTSEIIISTKTSNTVFNFLNHMVLRVKRRFDVLYVQRVVHQTIKLAVTFLRNFKKGGQSLICCCHAVFEGVSHWLNDGVHLRVDVGVG